MTTASAQPSLLRSAPRMDRRGGKKRSREGTEQESPAPGKKTTKGLKAEDAAVAALFEEAAATAATATAADSDAGGEVGAWQRPAWVFDLPWLKSRGGLGLSFAASPGWEHRDVFFRSLVDGAVATIGVPGDRFSSPPFKLTALFDDVEAWLATAGEDEVDPVWRSVLEGSFRKRTPLHDANVRVARCPRTPPGGCTRAPRSGAVACATQRY